MKWIVLIGALLVLLSFDLWLARRESKGAGMSVRKATLHSVGWLMIALGFGAGMLIAFGGRDAGLYFAGFLVEKSLSLDNVFVFLLILTSFGIPEAQRHRLLTWGIVAALVLRGVFIAVGATALHHASWISYIFAALLVWTGWRMFQHRHDSAGRDRVRREAQGAAAEPVGGHRRGRRAGHRRHRLRHRLGPLDPGDHRRRVHRLRRQRLRPAGPGAAVLPGRRPGRAALLPQDRAGGVVGVDRHQDGRGRAVGQARPGVLAAGDRARARHRRRGLAAARPADGPRGGGRRRARRPA